MEHRAEDHVSGGLKPYLAAMFIRAGFESAKSRAFAPPLSTKMAFWLQRLKRVSRVLPHSYSGNIFRRYNRDISLLSSPLVELPHSLATSNGQMGAREFSSHRFSTVSNVKHETPQSDLLTFIRSSIDFLEELNVLRNGDASLLKSLKGGGYSKQTEFTGEPHISSCSWDLLLCSPGCVSVDESGNRLFISDCEHHRIVVSDGRGKILDCIGSFPGFEDGEFETARLMRPAASFYLDAENCLYFVDSENNAIRKADMDRRVLETFYPPSQSMKKSGLWNWILDMLGMKRDVDTPSKGMDSESLIFPWHLIASEDSILVIDRSFETLWILDFTSAEIKEIVKGLPKVWEICGKIIMAKISLLKQMPPDQLEAHHNIEISDGRTPFDLVSSFAILQDGIIICDTVGQKVLRLCKESGAISNFQLSNFGILGLPYWMASSLETFYLSGDQFLGTDIDHFQCFKTLPGRVDIIVNLDISEDTELVEPLQGGSIWCQARGAASIASGAENNIMSTEKVGVAQQWYDELDNLALTTPELETSDEEESTVSYGETQENRIRFDCVVNTSPGTSEVIIYAALYLRLKGNSNSCESNQQKNAERIADALGAGRSGNTRRDSFIQLLLNSNVDLDGLVFVKPVHLRIKFDCLDHPKAENSRDIILTDSRFEVGVSL
ncbi:NHL repeat [Dillenia turbinata]|uniref:NHL repeat n=1 Tax=Dillenia turbinata TaxID=194707 RepID=A0AAN8ZNA1_9MAGN